MNGRTRQLTFIGALALAAAVSLLSCSSSDPTSPDIVGTPGGGTAGNSPVISFVLPDETCATAGTVITIFGDNFDVGGGQPTVTINGVAAQRVEVFSDGSGGEVLRVETGFDGATIPPGGLLVDVTVTTAAGSSTLPDAIRLLPGCTRPPAIVSIDPSSAPRTGGTALTISGVDLACATSVSFSGTQTPGLVLDADIIGVESDNTLIVEAPVNPAATSETFDVTVSSECGTGVLPGAFTFTGGDGEDVVPNATAIIPPEGPATGGNEVRIQGTDLGNVTEIRVGPVTIPSSDFLVQANGELLIPRWPPSPVGPSITVPVNVTVVAGGVADNSPVVYTYLGQGAPECDVLSPTSGTQDGGTNVIITAALGSTLDAIDGVLFGGVAAPTVLNPDPGVLAVVTPPYPFAIDVNVELTIDGTVVAACPLDFTYTPSDPSQAFSVESIFPAQGPQSGGTQIQISGSGLTAVSGIEICDVPAMITAASEELVTAVTGRFDGTTPATCDVVVTAGALGATLPAAFTYTPVVPDGQFFIDGAETAPEAGGLNFRIQGSELIGVTDVSFSGSQGASGQALACEVQVQSNTEVTGIVPRYFTPGGPFPADVGVFVQSSGGIDPTTAVSLASGRRFRYYANPSLLSASGPGGNELVSAGEVVTVTGVNLRPENDNFVGSLTISNSGVLDGTTAGEESLGLGFSVVDNNTLTFVFPSVRVQDFYDITIQTPRPALACTQDYSFTLLRSIFFGTPPSAASVKPPSGPWFGGTEVVITGDFDTEVTQVTIGGVVQPILEQTATTVTVVTQGIPEDQAGTPLDVVVTNRGGASTPLIGAYTFIPTPDVTSASTVTVNCPGLTNPPTVLPVTQGQVVTVTGNDLVGVNSASIGGEEATVFPVSDTQVQIAVPAEPGGGGPVFDIVLSASFEESPSGAQDDPLNAVLLTAVRYQNPPTVTGITPATGDAGAFIQIQGESLLNADGTPVGVTFGGTPATQVSSNSDGTLLTVQVPAGPEGQSVQVEVTTCQGSAFSPTVFAYPCNRPQANTLTPASGSGGTVVTIDGASLLSADGGPTTVTFGAQTALVDLVASTSTSLVVTAPPGNAGDRVEVNIETCGGTVLAGFFTYGCGTPQITGLTPSQGPQSGGTTVVISGSNLDSPDGTPVQVIFGPVATGSPAAVNTAASTSSQLVVTAPPGVGSVAVTVINCGGQATFSLTPFTYCTTPSATLDPADTQGAVGDVVAITGLGLLNPDSSRPVVTFGGVQATVLESPVPTNVGISVQVPQGSGNVIVEVETCGGVARAGSFQYCLPPDLTGFTPGAAAAGSLVTLSGSNLIGADGQPATVSFGANMATLVDDSPFVVQVPAAPPGTGTVTVTAETCGGTSTALFTYCDVPVITDVNVGGGAAEGPAGTAVSIVGTGLVGADGSNPTVLFGTQQATVLDASPTALLVTSPAGIANGTTVSVRVRTCGGSSNTNFTYDYRTLPECPNAPSAAIITAPAPAEGPAGTQVTIEGVNLIDDNGQPGAVLFGAFSAALVTSAENVPPGLDTLVVSVPDGGFPDLTNVTVTIVTCGGSTTVAGGYTYTAAGDCAGGTAPSGLALSPTTGGAGTQVEITGTNLFGADGVAGTVRFGPFTASVVTAVEDLPVVGTDTIVVTAPFGFDDGDVAAVTVQNCTGISGSVNFTYQGAQDCPGGAAPSALALNPATGGVGAQVTITGSDLFGPDGVAGTVRFGPFTATQVTAVQDVPAMGTDTIVVTAPAGFGDGDVAAVTVQNCVGLSASVNFTYQGAQDCPGGAAPSGLVLDPTTGGVGSVVAVSGSDLFGPDGVAGTVRFGAFSALVLNANEDFPVAGTDTFLVTAPVGFDDGDVAAVTVQNCVGVSASVNFTYQGAQDCPGGAAPSALALNPTTGGVGAQVTITGSDLFGPDGAAGTVRFGPFTASVVTAVEDLPAMGTDTIVVTAPSGFGDGDVAAVTVENCVGISASVNFTYQGAQDCPGGAAPSALALSPTTGGVGDQVTVTGSDLFGPDGAAGTVRFGPFTASVVTAVEDVPAMGTDTIVVTAPAGFDDGDVAAVTVENCVGLSASVNFTYQGDCVAPALDPVAADPGGPVNPESGPAGTLVTLTGTELVGADGADPVVQFGTRVATLVNVTPMSVTVQAPGGIPNNTPVSVRITTCGGTDIAVETYTYADVAACTGSAPGVAMIAPTSGAVGTPVEITGTDLIGPDGNVSQVRFGTFAATVIDVFDDPLMAADTMLVLVPSGPPVGSTVTVSVENCAGTDQSSTFTYEAPQDCVIQISGGAVSPVSGTAGEIVTITGMGLVGDDNAVSEVFFGVQPGEVLDQTATQILVRAPTNVPSGETVNVTVSHCGDTEVVGSFTYDTVFDAQAISPNSGPRTGGQTVVITGTGLSGADTVTICGVTATVDSATNNAVTITTGEYFGPAPAVCDVVVADAGTDSDTLPAAYTYTTLLPDGDSLDDSAGPDGPVETAPAAGGTAFRIRGTDLLDVDEVTFGGLVNDPKACDLQAQNDSMSGDDLVTGTAPAYRTPDGPFPAEVQIFVESAAGRDPTPVTRDGGGMGGLFTYYRNPRLNNAFTDDDLDSTPDADCGTGCGRPGQRVRVEGTAFAPEAWSHIGRLEIEEVGGGSGIAGELAFSIEAPGDGGGANSLVFVLPGNAQPGDVFDVTIFTPNGDSDCTDGWSYTLLGAVSVVEFVCDDGMDNDADGDIDCADSDCVGQLGPAGQICQGAESLCDDGGDNDGDGLVDCRDSDCAGLAGPAGQICEPGGESTCNDGLDNDGDGRIDCVLGNADADCPCGPETAADSNCDDGVDNDGDGNTDAADPDC